MGFLQRLRAGVRSLVAWSRELIATSRRVDSQNARVDPDESLGPRVHRSGYVHAYEDAARKLVALGEARIDAIVHDVGERLMRPVSRESLANAFKQIAERVSSDARIPVQAKDAAKAIAYRSRDALLDPAELN
ncbi:hypothetical protein EDM68_03630 [Candidatus Uhrbacteria bacterium]|jgi:hypothetical protein|nr:MAG: hypothetical protein EDM68_03630 [Candidatus Uhrbacteria bacterium]